MNIVLCNRFVRLAIGGLILSLALAPTRVFAQAAGDSGAARAGDAALIANSIGMKLALIPPGEFLMGSNETAEELAKVFGVGVEHFSDKYPPHRVRITQSFYIGAYEVTVGRFARFVAATGYETDAEKDNEGGWGWNETKGKFEGRDPKYLWRSPGFAQNENQPVVNVSYNDAKAFCQWLGGKERKTYRLPTEAQWEYACRAGATTRYSSGNDPESLVKVGNVADATAKQKLVNYPKYRYLESSDGTVFTAPVGRFRANRFGLYDMHGNVFEWCADWYDKEYYVASPLEDPRGPDSGAFRVLRGGSWLSGPSLARSAVRLKLPPDFHDGFDFGFRVVRDL